MGELGQLLRQTRHEKGIDLEQVANDTRIRVRFLEALEQENYDELPTPGHVHGFLRNYALYLGLDLNEVQALYEAENKESRFVPGIFRPKDIELAPPRRSLFRASLVFGVVLLLVAGVVSGWALWYYGLPAVRPLLDLLTPAAERTAAAEQTADIVEREATSTAIAAATKTPTEALATPTVVEATHTPTLVPTETPIPTATLDQPVPMPTSTPEPTKTRIPTRTPTPSPTPVEGVMLSIVVIERAWLQATVDGQALPGELLEAGEERTWEAKETIQFVCGNAGGVEVTVNGEELGTLGGRAEVVDRTWTPQGEVTPTPALP